MRTGRWTRQTQEESLTLEFVNAAQTLVLFILGQARRLRTTSLKGLPDASQLRTPYLLTLDVAQHTVVCPIDLVKDVAAANTLGAPNLDEPLRKTFAFDCHLVKLFIISRRLIEVGVLQR